MVIGEAGSITANMPTPEDTITVQLAQALTNPVFALTGTSNGNHEFVLRVIDQTLDANGDTTAFTFIIDEWEYLNERHSVFETINWLAIEEGVHSLPDGRIIEAGLSSISSNSVNTGGSASFNGAFTDPPIVLTNVMSSNDVTAVDSDPSNITASGFDITLQEEEAQDGVHGAETVGWIAIQSGGGDPSSGTATAYGAFDEDVSVFDIEPGFTNSVVLAETQTLDGPDTASVSIDSQSNTSVGLFLEEETSLDDEVGHVDETVGVVVFEDGLIPCFTAGTRILTPSGHVLVQDLRIGHWVTTADNGAQRIRWIGRRKFGKQDLAGNPNLRPVRILAQSLGMQLPERDLLVSRQHRMLAASTIAERMFGDREVLVSAIKLTALPGIYVDLDVDEVEYIHLLFDDHEILFAEGAQTESLFLGDNAQQTLSKEGRQEISQIFPDLASVGSAVKPARSIPTGGRQKQFMARHCKNSKYILN